MVQYLALREAARAPGILRRGTGATLSALGAIGALSPQGVHELGEALALLRHVRTLLALLFEGVPDPVSLSGPAGTTLARLARAVGFARLEAGMTAALPRLSALFHRLISRPV